MCCDVISVLSHESFYSQSSLVSLQRVPNFNDFPPNRSINKVPPMFNPPLLTVEEDKMTNEYPACVLLLKRDFFR